MKKLVIIIVNWNTADLTSRCLSSIKRNLAENLYDVYVVDNASSDKSAEVIRKNFKWVNLVVNDKNLGFAKANNQILKKIKNEYALILNPDTLIKKNSIEPLLNFLSTNQNAAMAGPALLNKDGSIQHFGMYRKAPSLLQALLFYTDLYKLSIKNKFLVNRFWESDVEKETISEVDQIPGAAMLARTAAFKKIGFFDEDYPFWFEDVDLCNKLRKNGYKLYYVPESKIIHFVGGATDKWQNRAKKEARFWKSLFIYFDKNKSVIESILVKTIIVGSQIFMLLSRLLMQIIKPNNKRANFIRLKVEILINLFRDNSLPVL